MSDSIRAVLRQGSGDPPAQWSVYVLEAANTSAEKLLNPEQREHVIEQVRDLARHADPGRSNVLDIDRVEDFYELRDKGGLLGKINLRVFYFFRKDKRTLVILGVERKEAEGQTPAWMKIKMRARKRAVEKSLDEQMLVPVTRPARRRAAEVKRDEPDQ